MPAPANRRSGYAAAHDARRIVTTHSPVAFVHRTSRRCHRTAGDQEGFRSSAIGRLRRLMREPSAPASGCGRPPRPATRWRFLPPARGACDPASPDAARASGVVISCGDSVSDFSLTAAHEPSTLFIAWVPPAHSRSDLCRVTPDPLLPASRSSTSSGWRRAGAGRSGGG